MTPEHLPTEQYEAQLAEKVVRLQTMMAPFAAPVPEVFRCLLYTSDAADDLLTV